MATANMLFADFLLLAVSVGCLTFLISLARDRESWSQYFQTTLIATVLCAATLVVCVWVIAVDVAA